MMDVAGSVARFFFNNSPKRQLAHDKHIHELHAQDSGAFINEESRKISVKQDG